MTLSTPMISRRCPMRRIDLNSVGEQHGMLLWPLPCSENRAPLSSRQKERLRRIAVGKRERGEEEGAVGASIAVLRNPAASHGRSRKAGTVGRYAGGHVVDGILFESSRIPSVLSSKS